MSKSVHWTGDWTMLDRYRQVTERLCDQLGRYPSRDEVIAEAAIEMKAEKDAAEARRLRELDEDRKIAGVVYPGNGKIYYYRVEEPFQIGEYLCVKSAWSNRDELVRVECVGRGPGCQSIPKRAYTTTVIVQHRERDFREVR